MGYRWVGGILGSGWALSKAESSAMEERSVWKERIEDAEEPIPGVCGRFTAEWEGGDIGLVSSLSLFVVVLSPSRIEALNFLGTRAGDVACPCRGRCSTIPGGRSLSFFPCESDDLKLIGSERLPRRFGFSFSGVACPDRSLATFSGLFCRKERSDMLLLRLRKPGRSEREEDEGQRWCGCWEARSCWDGESVEARFRAAAAAAAEMLDWTLLSRDSIARDAARAAGFDWFHSC